MTSLGPISQNPAMAPFWDHSLNGDLDPDVLLCGSTKKVWWKCSLKHNWQSSPDNFSRCPICSGKKVLAGFNDIGTTHPELAAQWGPGNEYQPTELRPGSGKKILWQCSLGHQWRASCLNRTGTAKSGCPVCSGKKVLAGFNDLSTTHPELAFQWDEGNELLPTEVIAGSGKKVNWTCSSGHTWSTSIVNRTNRKSGCPYCTGNKPYNGDSDLLAKHPEVIKEWDDSRDPSEFTPRSGQKVWWKCPSGHRWEARIADRVGDKTYGCPLCSGRSVIPGETDFSTKRPDLIKFWHPDNGFSPEEIAPNSSVMVQWVCDKGHSFSKTAQHMNAFSSCPVCYEGGSSEAEREIARFIGGVIVDDDVVRNTKSVITPYELDIYLPSHDLAIEYNGLYWHSEEHGKSRTYHYDKWKMCKEKGIQLITIWEDDWHNRQEVVKSMLLHKLGHSNNRRIGARECELSEVTVSEADKLLDTHHIQGSGLPGSVRYGLIHPEEGLVAVSIWRVHGSALHLDRYATSAIIPGGMSRLLVAGIKYGKTRGCTSIVTFADHTVSDGGLYERLGFRSSGQIKPDYHYVYRNRRHHKSQFRLSRFKTDPALIWKAGASESALAALNNLTRIWDCGKTRYEIRIE